MQKPSKPIFYNQLEQFALKINWAYFTFYKNNDAKKNHFKTLWNSVKFFNKGKISPKLLDPNKRDLSLSSSAFIGFKKISGESSFEIRIFLINSYLEIVLVPYTDIDGYESKSLTILKHISAHFNVVIPFQKWLI